MGKKVKSVSGLRRIVSVLLAKKSKKIRERRKEWMEVVGSQIYGIPTTVFVMLNNCLKVQHARIFAL